MSRSSSVAFLRVYDAGVLKSVTVELAERGIVAFDGAKRPLRRVSYIEDGDNKFVAGQVVDNEVKLWWSGAVDPPKEAVVRVADGHKVTSLKVGRAGTAIAGTDRGAVYHWELGDTATLTDVATTGSRPVTALSYVIGGHTFVVGTDDGTLSAWFRAPVAADGSLGLVRAVDFELAGIADHRHRSFDSRSHVCRGERRRADRASAPDLGPYAGHPARYHRRDEHRADPAKRRSARAAQQWRARSLRARESASGNQLADALRQGLVRGLRPARIRLAVDRRHRRLRAEAQPGPADLRHASKARSTR